MTADQVVNRYSLESADGAVLDVPAGRFYRGHVFLQDPGDFVFRGGAGWHFQETWSNGYRQVYSNKTERAVFTYCEGDLDMTVDATDEVFEQRLESAEKFYTEKASA